MGRGDPLAGCCVRDAGRAWSRFGRRHGTVGVTGFAAPAAARRSARARVADTGASELAPRAGGRGRAAAGRLALAALARLGAAGLECAYRTGVLAGSAALLALGGFVPVIRGWLRDEINELGRGPRGARGGARRHRGPATPTPTSGRSWRGPTPRLCSRPSTTSRAGWGCGRPGRSG